MAGRFKGAAAPILPLALRASVGLHAAVLVGLVMAPARWRTFLGLAVANHGVLVAAGLLPRCPLLGPNLRRLPLSARRRGEVALTFDDGPDPEVTPRVLDLLDGAGVRATFFCIGERAAASARLAAEIVRRGHGVENHTFSHPNSFSLLSLRRQAEEIDRAQEGLARVCGRRPTFFRSPAGIRTPLVEPLLARRGLRLVSWTRRGFDAVDADPRRVAARLTSGLRAGDVLLLHDRRGGRRSRPPAVLGALPLVLEALVERGLHSVPLTSEHLG